MAAASITPQSLLISRRPKPNNPFFHSPAKLSFLNPNHKRCSSLVVGSGATDFDVIPVLSDDIVDQQGGGGGVFIGKEAEETEVDLVVGGFGADSSARLTFEGAAGFSASASESADGKRQLEMSRLFDRTINASIALAAGSFAVAKLLTVDHNYWHGWTVFEILRYAPQHNWSAYEAALKTNPVLAKMVISGVVYSLGDWIAQCYEGKSLFEFDRSRIFRSGLVGFSLHGSLSHYYYHFCEALFPFDNWWVVPAKVAFDQTAWSAVWNSIYFILLGVLRRESPANIFSEWKATFRPMLTAGWKLWPFAHLITYGVVPVEQRLLWVDTVELVWVTILSTYSNEKSENRASEVPVKTNPIPTLSKGSSEE